MGTLAEDDGVVVLDLDNAVSLEGGGELGPGLGEGAGHGEGQDGEEEKSTLHCCCDKVVLSLPATLGFMASALKSWVTFFSDLSAGPSSQSQPRRIGQHFQSSATPGRPENDFFSFTKRNEA